jgi:hypothetical protein
MEHSAVHGVRRTRNFASRDLNRRLATPEDQGEAKRDDERQHPEGHDARGDACSTYERRLSDRKRRDVGADTGYEGRRSPGRANGTPYTPSSNDRADDRCHRDDADTPADRIGNGRQMPREHEGEGDDEYHTPR